MGTSCTETMNHSHELGPLRAFEDRLPESPVDAIAADASTKPGRIGSPENRILQKGQSLPPVRLCALSVIRGRIHPVVQWPGKSAVQMKMSMCESVYHPTMCVMLDRILTPITAK